MKTILALVVLFILTGIGYATTTIHRMKSDGYIDAYWSDVICLEGYKFAVVKVSNNNGIAITQVMELRNGFSYIAPMRCGEK